SSATDNGRMQQCDLECVALDAKAIELDASDHIRPDGAEACGAVADAIEARNVTSYDVAHSRVESPMKAPLARNAASAHVSTSDDKISAILESTEQARYVCRFVGEVCVHLKYRVRSKLVERVAHASYIGCTEALLLSLQGVDVGEPLAVRGHDLDRPVGRVVVHDEDVHVVR